MRKVLFLLLSCIVAQGSVNAMEPAAYKISYTDHARRRMLQRHIFPESIREVLRTGNQTMDLDTGTTIFRSHEKGSPGLVVYATKISPLKYLVVTAYKENADGSFQEKTCSDISDKEKTLQRKDLRAQKESKNLTPIN